MHHQGWPRGRVPWGLVLGAAHVLLVACGDGGAAPAPDGGVDAGPGADASVEASATRVLLELGAAPRQLLSATAGPVRDFVLEATSSERTSVDGDERVERAELEGTVTMTATGSVPLVVGLRTTPERLTSTLLDGAPVETASTIQRFDAQGALLSENRSTRGRSVAVLDVSTLSVFTLPEAVLAVPTEPVGVGARWIVELTTEDAVLEIEHRVVAMDDATLRVERTTRLVEGRGVLTAAEGSATLEFDVDTLLLRDARVESRIAFATTLPIEGRSATLTGSTESLRVLQEAGR